MPIRRTTVTVFDISVHTFFPWCHPRRQSTCRTVARLGMVADVSSRPILFLTVGLPDVGETTRAQELASAHRVVRLTPDDPRLRLLVRRGAVCHPGHRRDGRCRLLPGVRPRDRGGAPAAGSNEVVVGTGHDLRDDGRRPRPLPGGHRTPQPQRARQRSRPAAATGSGQLAGVGEPALADPARDRRVTARG